MIDRQSAERTPGDVGGAVRGERRERRRDGRGVHRRAFLDQPERLVDVGSPSNTRFRLIHVGQAEDVGDTGAGASRPVEQRRGQGTRVRERRPRCLCNGHDFVLVCTCSERARQVRLDRARSHRSACSAGGVQRVRLRRQPRHRPEQRQGGHGGGLAVAHRVVEQAPGGSTSRLGVLPTGGALENGTAGPLAQQARDGGGGCGPGGEHEPLGHLPGPRLRLGAAGFQVGQ